LNKAPGEDNLTVECIKFAHPSLLSIIAKIFNIMLHGGVVPKDFENGIIIPIPKVRHISKCPKSEDFRGITLNTILSKIFELCLSKFFSSIPLSDRQFGFRKKQRLLGCHTYGTENNKIF
jgi:hypothetical protein